MWHLSMPEYAREPRAFPLQPSALHDEVWSVSSQRHPLRQALASSASPVQMRRLCDCGGSNGACSWDVAVAFQSTMQQNPC